jgi:hypothetical protein
VNAATMTVTPPSPPPSSIQNPAESSASSATRIAATLSSSVVLAGSGEIHPSAGSSHGIQSIGSLGGHLPGDTSDTANRSPSYVPTTV